MNLKKCSQFVSRTNVWQDKIKLFLIPAKKTPHMGSKQFDCPITNHITAFEMTSKQNVSESSMKIMTLFASAFAKPMKISACLFLFHKTIKCFAFLFTFCLHVYFPSSYESRSIHLSFIKILTTTYTFGLIEGIIILTAEKICFIAKPVSKTCSLVGNL